MVCIGGKASLGIFKNRSGLFLDKGGGLLHQPRPRANPAEPIQPNQTIRMRGVIVKKGEPVDRALKRLKTKLDTEGILEEMRRRRAFETPTERKQRKLRSASKRNKIRWRYSNAPLTEKVESED
jgi:small subunit ribosomal protein S21